MKIVFFANTDWYLYNFRLALALALRAKGHEVVMMSPTGDFGARFAAAGLRWIALPMQRRSLNPLNELILLIHIWKLLRKERPVLIHNFTIKCVVYGSLAALFAGVNARVNAVAGLGFVFVNESRLARMLRPMVSLLLRFVLNASGSRLILQNSDDVSLFTAAHLVSSKNIRLIRGSGVNTSLFQPNRVWVTAQSHSAPRVLLAARLLWDKGIGEFVEAARTLRDRGVNVICLLAGTPDPGNPASITAAELESWKSEGLVALLGQVGDMVGLLQSVQIAVLPSYREGLPKSLIEAAACGLPVITTNVPGCREVVAHGVTGLVVPVRDAASLARAIEQLCVDPQLAQQMGHAGRVKVLAEFDERIVVESTLRVYEELLPLEMRL
jgi:glycosyltransferase involved in cell wall biosynthesis